jgi:NifU-like protein involved in Fe-S cluster formation
VGTWIRDQESRIVRFSVQIRDGVIDEVRFNASFCVSLIAYCEVLAEWATGTVSEHAARIRPADLTAALACVPPYKRHLAGLATEALSSAIQESGGLK